MRIAINALAPAAATMSCKRNRFTVEQRSKIITLDRKQAMVLVKPEAQSHYTRGSKPHSPQLEQIAFQALEASRAIPLRLAVGRIHRQLCSREIGSSVSKPITEASFAICSAMVVAGPHGTDQNHFNFTPLRGSKMSRKSQSLPFSHEWEHDRSDSRRGRRNLAASSSLNTPVVAFPSRPWSRSHSRGLYLAVNAVISVGE